MQHLVICRCEEITLAELEKTAEEFNCTARELKLRTRAGMGFCGGRTCRPAVDKVISHLTNENPTDALPLKVAPPVRPISLQDLGGESNE